MRSAPVTEWQHFQDWVLMMMSCQLYASDQGLKRESNSYGHIVHTLWMVAQYTRHDKMRADVDLVEICELIDWALSIVCDLHPHFKTQSPLQTHLTKRKISEATQTARKMGICPNRLSNLAVGGGERQGADLPTLIRMLEDNAQHPAKSMKSTEHKERGGLSQAVTTRLNHDSKSSSGLKESQRSSDHISCTEEVCCLSSIDSTRVQQLHKCSTEDCGEPLRFLSSEFHRPCERFTWWLDNDQDIPKIADEKRAYMAISHVWSDGTGGGVQGEGCVNRCLFDYFKEIATELGCTAIWWDTISIPLERKARQKAITRMHENFQGATHVVIHDQDLIQLPWTDDGRPCLAILISTWFTRAWTALELMMSRKGKVSVIFRDPHDYKRHVIKNLENDILARHPAYSSRGHWIASSLISQLRGRQFNSIGDIQKVLRTRSTSWPRDLMVIAGLLTGHKPKIDIPGFIAHTTREIINGLVEIEDSFLFHGHATMAQEGGYSWCPFSLLDVHIRIDATTQHKVFVDELGAAVGLWTYRESNEEDAKNTHPYNFHVSVDYQIRAALVQWENFLLLQNSHRHDTQALLVIPVDVDHCRIWNVDYVVLDCLYVGTVSVNLEWGPDYSATVRLGKTTGHPGTDAQEVIDRYEDTKGPRLWGNPWAEHLASIKQERKQSLDRT